jgi:hypothetical protein
LTKTRAPEPRSLRLKPADPFELIRWLARSQSDPRKAVAELVQNSLDAGGRLILVERRRRKGVVELRVRDDGAGVIPEMSREDALAYIATHVGRSRKLNLDPTERMKRVVAGKYGVGLLGFWSVGGALELRSRVAGSKLHALRLVEDSPEAQILTLPSRTDDPETFTEVIVSHLHEAAVKALGGRRLSDYLAAELRGQLLMTGASVEIHDGIARGIAQKQFVVAPRRFAGEALNLPGEIDVPGHAPIRVDLYLARGADRPAIQVAAAGTLVADDIAELSTLELAVPPWIGREIVGILDYASFNVPPGTRRGVMPDGAALAFADALENALAPLVLGELQRLEGERSAALDRDMARELRRALRGFRRRLPQYLMPRVEDGTTEDAGAAGAGEVVPDAAPPIDDTEPPSLFPPGPLVSVRIVPPRIAVPPGGERRVRAVASDASDRRPADVTFTWSVVDAAGAGIGVRAEGLRPAVTAPAHAFLGATAELHVEARQGSLAADAVAQVRVEESEEDIGAALGIPEPHLVSDSDGDWRSRLVGERWEVNDEHEDYRSLRALPKARVRYLLALLAREIVLRTSGRPDVAGELDQMVEILAHAERNLRGG